MTSIAGIGTTQFNTLADAAAALVDGQTLNITRSGNGAEATATFNKPGSYKILGTKDANGALPMLHLDINTRPAWGKAIINLEDGSYEIGYLQLDGCAVPDSNGAGIRMNPTSDIVRVHHFRLTNNENGVLTAEGQGELYLNDGVLDANGKSTDPARQGYSHNAYIGKINRFEAARVSFTNSAYGHDLKSRALVTVLNQVLCSGSAAGRALDLPNGGVLLATDTKFEKNSSAKQNNLIDIGAEGITDGRKEQYVLTNCHFHNDLPIERDVQFIKNRSQVEVLLIDPLFTGAAAKKAQSSTLVGNIRIQMTGGPLGPRVAVGGDPGSTAAVPPPTTTTPTPAPAPTPTPTPTPAPTTTVVKFALVTDPGAGTYTQIGKENDTITVPDNTIVRYGANGKYLWAKVSGKFVATNTFFTKDPIQGVAKVVESFAPAATTTPTPTPTPTPAPTTDAPQNPGVDATAWQNLLNALQVVGSQLPATLRAELRITTK